MFEGTVTHSALREANQSSARDYSQHFKLLTFTEATQCHLPLLGGNIYLHGLSSCPMSEPGTFWILRCVWF